ncbi:Glucose 1-dehydrogenase [Dirofilaria immitis]
MKNSWHIQKIISLERGIPNAMFRCFTLSLLLSIVIVVTSDMLYNDDDDDKMSHVEPFFNDATKCDYGTSSILISSSEINNLIPNHSVSVMENTQQISLYNLWSYLLYRWSIVLYFVPLIVIILCKCKIINCDVRLIYGNMPDDYI